MRPVTQSPLCEAALAASLRFWVVKEGRGMCYTTDKERNKELCLRLQ